MAIKSVIPCKYKNQDVINYQKNLINLNVLHFPMSMIGN